MRVDYHPDARRELIASAQFYESRVVGLGGRFLDEYDATIEEILLNPLAYAVVEDDIRLHLMKRFPMGIYYRVRQDSIMILVVKHHSRDSEYWKYRK